MADLTPANQNPWYVLSTLKGEQTGDEIDWDLARDNARLWNIWACQNLTGEERQALKGQGADVPDAGAWGEHAKDIETLYAAEMTARNDEGFSIPDLPDPMALYDMSKIAFSHTVVWGRSIFASLAYFASATFTQYASFRSATFTQDAYFRSATFTQTANFASATFTQDASFRSATFTQDASFYSATFTQAASFISATFTQAADFAFSTFTQDAYFASATFTQGAYFASATFTQDASFRSAIFSGRGYFLDTKFGDPDNPTDKRALLDLTDTLFDKPASFRGAWFLNRFPEFRGTILPEQTLFPFDKHAWPQSYPLFDEEWKPERHEAYRTLLMHDAANSCAVLRNHVKKQGHPEAEHYFFRREMGFLRQVGSPLERLPYKLFGWISDYGHSIAKPAGLLTLLLVVPALLYTAVFARWRIIHGEQFGVLEGFGFSFSNCFKFFGLQRTFFADTLERIERLGALTPWLETLAATQTVLSFILLFFLGLGLRQRFRLR